MSKEITKEEISLCEQIAEKYRKEVKYGDWYINYDVEIRLKGYAGKGYRDDEAIPLWTISDCLEFFEKVGLNQEFHFKHFNNGGWSFTAEDNKYRKIRGEGETRLSACLKAVLAVVEESKDIHQEHKDAPLEGFAEEGEEK